MNLNRKSKSHQKIKQNWSAFEIREHLQSKFNIVNNDFWKWLFADIKFGDLGIINFTNFENPEMDFSFKKYVRMIKSEFGDDDSDEIEIENDL